MQQQSWLFDEPGALSAHRSGAARSRAQKRGVGLTLTFDAQLDAAKEAGTAAAPRRFRGIAYSGRVVPGYGFLGDIAIDLESLRNADGDELPVLAHHERTLDAIAGRGVIRRIRTDDGLALEIEGELTDSTEYGQKVQRLLAERFPLQLSVGLTGNFREINKPIRINGRELAVAGVFEDALVREVSFVPVGADPATGADALFQSKENVMSDKDRDEGDVQALRARSAELEAEIASLRTQRRTEQLGALMQEIGREMPSGDALKPYVEMSDEAFAVFAADMRAVAARARKIAAADPKLFQAISTRMAGGDAADAADEAQRRQGALLPTARRYRARCASTQARGNGWRSSASAAVRPEQDADDLCGEPAAGAPGDLEDQQHTDDRGGGPPHPARQHEDGQQEREGEKPVEGKAQS